MNQSLSETLIALGLVKNVIPGVERASTAVAVSMERMADPEVQRIEDELVARLDRQFPGTAARICYRESATPLSHSRFTRASDGSGYGLAATPDQFLDKRPGYRGPIDGLYLCGASTRAGHGIAGAMMSGLKAAQRILRRSARS
jgi:phytoene dehydrogenase-like protein